MRINFASYIFAIFHLYFHLYVAWSRLQHIKSASKSAGNTFMCFLVRKNCDITMKCMSKCYYYDINFGRAKAYPLYVDSLSARRINCDARSRQIQPHACVPQLISFSLLLDRNSPHPPYFPSSFPYYVICSMSLCSSAWFRLRFFATRRPPPSSFADYVGSYDSDEITQISGFWNNDVTATTKRLIESYFQGRSVKRIVRVKFFF